MRIRTDLMVAGVVAAMIATACGGGSGSDEVGALDDVVPADETPADPVTAPADEVDSEEPAPAWPGKRVTTQMVVVDGEPLFVGGWSGGSAARDVWRYTAGAWVQGAVADGPNYPVGHATVAAGSDVYVYGGPEGQPTAAPVLDPSLYRYDVAADAWSVVETSGDAPPGLELPGLVYIPSSNALLLHGGQQVVDGGGGGALPEPIATTWRLDLSTLTWELVADEAPSRRFAHAMAYDAALDGVVLFAGGSTEDTSVWVYDDTTRTWTERPQAEAPPVVTGGRLVYDAVGERTLLVGGEYLISSSPRAQVLEAVWAYDAGADAWSEVATLPDGGRTFPLVATDTDAGILYVYGGVSDPSKGTISDEFHMLDLETLEWTSLG